MIGRFKYIQSERIGSRLDQALEANIRRKRNGIGGFQLNRVNYKFQRIIAVSIGPDDHFALWINGVDDAKLAFGDTKRLVENGPIDR